MYNTFPYTTNYNILKVTKEDSTEEYVVEFLFKAFKAPNTNYSIYLYINKDVLKGGTSSLDTHIKSAVKLAEDIDSDQTSDKSIIYINDSGLTPGVDYAWSEDLFNDYGKALLEKETVTDFEKYYIKSENIINNPDELTSDELYNKNIEHFYNINNYNSIIDSNYFTEEELYSFTSTFFTQIEQLTTFDFNDPVKMSSNKYNSLYKTIIDYYINNKSDSTYNSLNLVLSNTLSSTSSTSSCGCSSSSLSSVSLTESCANQYTSAMKAWLNSMTGDIDNFYNVWFYIESTDDKGKPCYKPNTDLIDILIKLIDEFTTLGLDLSFSSTDSKFHHCNCQSKTSSNTSDCNYKIINNFKEVLTLIENDSVQDNQNKIKTYGKAFGELLYKLYF